MPKFVIERRNRITTSKSMRHSNIEIEADYYRVMANSNLIEFITREIAMSEHTVLAVPMGDVLLIRTVTS